MLPKELIDCRLRGTRILPQFLSVQDQGMLDLCQRMMEAFEPNLSRGQIEETLDEICAGELESPKLADALKKTLVDRAQFTTPTEADYPAERRKILLAAAQALRSGTFDSQENFKGAVQRQCLSPLWQQGELYADLPDNDRFVSLHEMTPRELLERVNLGYVQGLLLYANKLEITIQDSSRQKLRRLLGRLRFHRLMAKVENTVPLAPVSSTSQTEDSFEEGSPLSLNGAIRLTIDGPCSVLSQSKSYGMQLALFFPAVCAFEHWRLRTKITWKGSPRILELDQDDKLAFHGSTGAYEPQEITVFRQNFADKAPFTWHIVEEPHLLKAPHGKIIIPDLTVETSPGKLVYLELFHRWHASQLLERLDFLDQTPPTGFVHPPLALGVERSLLGSPEIENRLNQSEWFQNHGFLFRDFPTSDKVIKAIDF